MTLDIAFNDYHLVFPVAIGTLLAVLLVAIGVKAMIARLREGNDKERQRFRFFDQGFDRKKLFGSLVCMVLYALLLAPLGFLVASILFILAVSLIYNPTSKKRMLAGITANAICTPLVIWLVFGQLFDITLP